MLERKVFGLVVLVGIFAGIVGIVFTNLLHVIQHLTFGYSAAEHLSFGVGVAQASGERRIWALLACGHNHPAIRNAVIEAAERGQS